VFCAVEMLFIENPLWGAPRIHGKLLKLGFAVAQSSKALGLATLVARADQVID
jgi:hypothetical protein